MVDGRIRSGIVLRMDVGGRGGGIWRFVLPWGFGAAGVLPVCKNERRKASERYERRRDAKRAGKRNATTTADANASNAVATAKPKNQTATVRILPSCLFRTPPARAGVPHRLPAPPYLARRGLVLEVMNFRYPKRVRGERAAGGCKREGDASGRPRSALCPTPSSP